MRPKATPKSRPVDVVKRGSSATNKPVNYALQANALRIKLNQENDDLGTATKYALVLKLAEALHWPSSVKSFNLCGFDSRLSSGIRSQMERLKIQGKDLHLTSGASKLSECQIIVADDHSQIEDALELQSKASVLTVGIGRAFIKSGIGLALYVGSDQTPGLSVNRTRLEANGIKVGDVVLKLADEVY